jgi:hypothetical protein
VRPPGPLTAKLCVEVLFQFVHLVFAFLLFRLERVDFCPDLFERGLQVLECFRGGQMDEGRVDLVPARVSNVEGVCAGRGRRQGGRKEFSWQGAGGQ